MNSYKEMLNLIIKNNIEYPNSDLEVLHKIWKKVNYKPGDSYYKVNQVLHIFFNICHLKRDNSRYWNEVNASWMCPHRWIKSKT